MGDDKDNKQQDPSKEALANGVKAAANAYAGPVGGKVADLAMKTETGQELLNKGSQTLNNVPGIGNNASKGVLPTALNSGTGAENESSIESEDSNPFDITSKFKKDASTKGEGLTNLLESNGFKKKLIIGLAGFAAGVLVLIIIIAVLYGPIESIKKFAINAWDKVVDFFTKDVAELEEDYYTKLFEVRDNLKDNHSICIDVNMIQAALTVNEDYESVLEKGNCVVNEDGSQDCSESAKKDAEKKEFKRMKKQVELLANMQIKRIKYGYDANLKSAGKYCVPCDKSKTSKYSTDTLVDSSNAGDFVIFGFNDVDSSTAELVAKHDVGGLKSLFVKKADEETNYEFRFYIPSSYYDSGVCKCDDTVPNEVYELSVGTYENREEQVFYYNLINSFIPSYYSEYLEGLTEEEKNKKIVDIADEIYLLYDFLGPDQTCGMQCSNISLGDSNLCPNGIEVDGNLVPFEDYVAGVVAAENSWHQGDNIESLKAQAIAARTYAIKRTNYCQTAIGNSSSSQNYKPTTDSYILRAVSETAGIILTTGGNQIVSSEYDASAVKEVSDEAGGYILNQNDQLIPFGSEDTIGMTTRHKCVCKKYTSDGTSTCGNACHGRGMSQIGARYLQTQGYTYDEILKYYYGDVFLTATGDSSTGDRKTNTLTLCSNVGGSSPDGTLTSGTCNTNSYYLGVNYWASDLNPYYSKYVGECTWYAFGRSLKALVEDGGMEPDSAKKLLKDTFLHRSNNGGEWYKNATIAGTLRYGNDIDAITPGSIVSSSGTGPAGHVFFVEGVNYNTDGTVDSLVITERSGENYCVYSTKKVTRNGNTTKVGNVQFYGFVSILGG